MNKYFIKTIVSLALLCIVLLPFSVSAFESYETTTYQFDGTRIKTPHAYETKEVLNAADLQVDSLNKPNDVFVDKDEHVYIADTANNRILCYDDSFKLLRIIDEFESEKGNDSLLEPKGVYVTQKGEVYIADTGNERIVHFSPDYKYIRSIGRPNTKLLDESFVFSPISVVVDEYGRIFIVAENVIYGLIELDEVTGDFKSFFGAKRVIYNPIDYLWRTFMTAAQLERIDFNVPTEYNNVLVDKDGFVYVTSSAYDVEGMLAEILTRNKSGRNTPIRKLNQNGDDILTRKGYFPPVGYLPIGEKEAEKKLSNMIDITLGENGVYSVLDAKRNRIFTYSQDGDLLYEFSGFSSQNGCSQIPVSIAYKGTDLLLLDSGLNRLTVFKQTEYGRMISMVLKTYQNCEYDDSISYWKQILVENANFDIAYDGIGKSMLNKGQYRDAMKYFQLSNNKKMYSIAYKEFRNQIANRYLLIIIIFFAVIITVLYYLFRWIKNRNNSDKYKIKHEGLLNQILYGFYIIFHPFDGYWDLKHERRGSLKAANIILLLAAVTIVLQKVMTAFLFNADYFEPINILSTAIGILGPVFLFITANWCFTSLMDGSGSFKDIYVVTSYSLLPVILLRLPLIPVSYILTLDEGVYLTAFNSFSIIWSVFLIFCGILVVHEFTFGKNIGICLFSIVGMAIIIFIILLVLTTFQYIGSFINSIFLELALR